MEALLLQKLETNRPIYIASLKEKFRQKFFHKKNLDVTTISLSRNFVIDHREQKKACRRKKTQHVLNSN